MSLRVVSAKYFRLGLMTLSLMFNCLPVADAISRRKRNFCHGSAGVITFYVISAVLLHQPSSDYGHYITF